MSKIILRKNSFGEFISKKFATAPFRVVSRLLKLEFVLHEELTLNGIVLQYLVRLRNIYSRYLTGVYRDRYDNGCSHIDAWLCRDQAHVLSTLRRYPQATPNGTSTIPACEASTLDIASLLNSFL